MTPSPLLVTFPGRAGDLLWALPSIRALSRRLGEPIDLMIAGEFAGMLELLRQQPYLGHVSACPDWSMSHGWQPPAHYTDRLAWVYSRTLHLGYRRWPELPLAQETLYTLNLECAETYLGLRWNPIPEAELHLPTPWITLPGASAPECDVTFAFSETHFELKFGIVCLLLEQLTREAVTPVYDYRHAILSVPESRWQRETWFNDRVLKVGGWSEYARVLLSSHVAVCCNSGAHVLAVALGTPVVMVEPMEARWNPIFFPVGQDGPQVTLVTGHDGLPTFDARAVKAALTAALERTAP